MTSINEDDTELIRNTIRYLHNVTTLEEINVPALKSFYSTKRRLLELRKSISIPSNLTRTSVVCQRCLLNLREGPASYRVIPEKKQSRFAKKLLIKERSGKPLTKYQRDYLKKHNNFAGNHLSITCKFCKNESVIKLKKPEKVRKPKIYTPQISSHKKKRKKKDKFCGLNQDIVLSLTPQNMRNLDSSDVFNTNDFKTSKLKIRKRASEGVETPSLSKEEIKENKLRVKKKKKNLNRLSEFLSNSSLGDKSAKSPAGRLKDFLQGL